MDTENENAQVDVVEQEEQTSADVEVDNDSDFGQDDETITIPKSKFNAIRRKATAYDANKDKPQINNRPSDSRWKEEMELKVEGYTSKDELAFIMKNGGKKALENPYIVTAIEAMRTKQRAEAAIMGDQGQKSATDKRFNPKDFSKMSSEEQLKALSEQS